MRDRRPVVTVEHLHCVERRERRSRDVLTRWRPFTEHRYVCACGTATHWYRDPRDALAAAVRHALDGQLSLA